jgi:poly(hydroxyalkanoate) depolymerase family esterase
MLNPMFDAWATLCGVDPFSWDFASPRPRSATSATPRPELISARYTSDAGSLDYKLFIPENYDGSPCPLVIMLHGCSQDARDFARGTGMNAVADQAGCLVAYPEQSPSANSGKCWNWFEDAHHHRGGGEPALIAGVTRQIMDDYAVDPGRVFVAGLSAGGAMAVVLGRTYPDLFAAVGCHSGLAYGCAVGTGAAMQAMQYGQAAGTNRAGSSVTPLIVFHGDMDGTVHPRNGEGVIEQSLQLSGLRHLSAHETGEARGRSFTREVHRSAAGGILAERWTVHGSGHAWSGGQREGSYADAKGPDASREMLRFFLAVCQERGERSFFMENATEVSDL